MENRVFFPQAALDQWIVDATVDLQNGVLTILGDGRRYQVHDAVRVIREVSGGADTHRLVGRVKGRAFLEQLGAEIVENSMLVGESAFDVETGWLGTPTVPFAEHAGSDARKAARGGGEGKADAPKTDEELLARFLANDL